jgi:hypothetical protein
MNSVNRKSDPPLGDMKNEKLDPEACAVDVPPKFVLAPKRMPFEYAIQVVAFCTATQVTPQSSIYQTEFGNVTPLMVVYPEVRPDQAVLPVLGTRELPITTIPYPLPPLNVA